jgi:nucleoside-diphosphate-sugar epimerase
MMSLITGADGYLGRKLLRRLLDTTDDEVVAGVRAKSTDELASKRQQLLATFAGDSRRILVRAFNVTEAETPELDLGAVRTIFHAAALTSFGVSRADAQEVNVLGTARVVALARRCSKLERLVLLSTLYSSGLRAGTIPETAFDDSAGFANEYEWSKWSAEQVIALEGNALPWQVHRIGTVLCDDDSGRVEQFNVAHKIWRLLHAGLLPIVPGRPATALPIVTGALAARASCELAERGENHSYAHVCFPSELSLPLESYVDVAYDAFLQDPDFRRRRVLRPLFTDELSFYRLSETAGMFSRDSLGTVAALVRPFAKQLFVPKHIETPTLARLGAPLPVDVRQLVGLACAHLVREHWAEPARSA